MEVSDCLLKSVKSPTFKSPLYVFNDVRKSNCCSFFGVTLNNITLKREEINESDSEERTTIGLSHIVKNV